MREPLPQPLMIDGAQTFVRNTSLVLNALGFRGLIVMWSGAIAEIPPGWALCDGTQGTPDLRDRFIVGARSDVDGTAKCLLTVSACRSSERCPRTPSTIPDGVLPTPHVGIRPVFVPPVLPTPWNTPARSSRPFMTGAPTSTAVALWHLLTALS